MAEQYVGATDINHIAQPVDTELCFAACVTALTGGDLSVIQMSLENAYVSEENGSTGPPFFKQEVPILGKQTTLIIDIIQSPEEEASDTAGVIDLVTEKLKEGTPVALMYKKTADPADERYHWVLLAGYSEGDERITAVSVMDPLADAMQQVEPLEVVDMIERSMQFGGVFAYSLQVQ